MTDSFSKRHGFRQVHETPIIVSDDAPYELRGVVVQLAYECGFRPRTLRPLVCRVLRKRQDDNNWSEYPNIDGEVTSLVDDCEWYRFYDVVEAIAAEMHETPFSFEPEKFATEMNDYFLENGIGWKLANAKFEVRGTVLFEQTLRQAKLELGSKGFSTALNEIHESIHDLSRRPTPDMTGAIQHSMAALECVARVCCGDENRLLVRLSSAIATLFRSLSTRRLRRYGPPLSGKLSTRFDPSTRGPNRRP